MQETEYPTHPGRLVREIWLRDAESVPEAAQRLSMSESELRRLADGETGVTPALALQLESAGAADARFWMRAQAYYDLARERERQARAA